MAGVDPALVGVEGGPLAGEPYAEVLMIEVGWQTGSVVLQPVDVFVRLVEHRSLACGWCGQRDEYRVPVVLDWRDYEAVAMLRRSCPAVACSGCGEPVLAA